MADDIILNKAQIIENCLLRIDQEYAGNPANLRSNQTKQDSILLNLERACQAAIDMAMRLVRLNKLGLPKETREAFSLLEGAGMIDAALTAKLHALVGFRNTAVHNYKMLDLNIVEAVLTKHLSDLQAFSAICLKNR